MAAAAQMPGEILVRLVGGEPVSIGSFSLSVDLGPAGSMVAQLDRADVAAVLRSAADTIDAQPPALVE